MTTAKEKTKKRKKARQKQLVEQVQLMIDFSLLLATTSYIRAVSASSPDRITKAKELMVKEDFFIIEKVLKERGFKQDNIDFVLLDTFNVVMGNLGFEYDEKRLLAAIERIKKATSQKPVE